MLRRLPFGLEFYKKMIDGDYYYVDKTLLIKEIIDGGAEVTLFTRPRRFGKTLSQTMLQTFFEREYDGGGAVVDKRPYFAGKKIMDAGEEYARHLGQYPVIFLSLKSAKQPSLDMARECLIDEIKKEFSRHSSVLTGGRLDAADAERYNALRNGSASAADYATSLAFLSQMLAKAEGRGAVILIDEYDVPLENAWACGFYPGMAAFIRSLFESALKTNPALERGVITGCLRISKESIFTGLNNPRIVSILNDGSGEYFGFLQEEVDAMLSYYGLADKRDEVKDWYDGYRFGSSEVYNPWSIISYVSEHYRGNRDSFPRPYWANTSSNAIVRDLVENADASARRELEGLMLGGTIEKPVHEEITYGDIHKSRDSLWSILLFTGYLRPVRQRMAGEQILMAMGIPNREVRSIYGSSIQQWFDERVTADHAPLHAAVCGGDAAAVSAILSGYLQQSISYHDYSETFYHGFLLGLLQDVPGYAPLSNREAGLGRYDIMLVPDAPERPGIILELKATRAFADAGRLCDAALAQIDAMGYAAELEAEGCTGVIKFGLCFFKKSCTARTAGGGHGERT